MIAAHAVQDVLRGTLEGGAVVVDEMAGDAQKAAVKALPIEQRPHVAGDVLRMKMIGGGEGFPQLFSYLDGLVLKHKRFNQMDNVGPFHGLSDHFLVGRSVLIPQGLYHGLEDGEDESPQRKLRLRLIGQEIGAGQDSDLVAGFLKVPGRATARCGHTVSDGIIAIDYK